jgi:eukaryotic-like serine/threonine-protein kinase
VRNRTCDLGRRRDRGRDVEIRSVSEPRTARVTRAQTRRTREAVTVAEAPTSPGGPVVLERYRLVRRLGTGAFGTVWMARDERLERDVAVKILGRERIVGGRFEREARAAARLSHPAIVTLYEAAVDDEGAYLVSELVHGSTLDALLAEGRFSDQDIVGIGIALCDALQHAHAQGVVHRDVKPSNILVPDAPPSAAQVAKLTDFGVARLVGSESLTLTGDVIGTLAYMAPEQAQGHDAGPAADLYSLAIVLYEALTGVNPVAPGGARSVRRLGTYLPPVRRQRRDLPRALGAGLDRALRPQPRERGSLAELHEALTVAAEEVGDEPGIVGAPATPWTTIRHRDDAIEDHAASAPEPAEATEGIRLHPTLARGLAAAATGGITAWLVGAALTGPLLPPAVAGLLAAAAVLLLPRLGWAIIVLALAATAAGQGRPGTALLIALALLLPVALLPIRPALWPLAAAAPALGLMAVAGLAGSWPALAGRAATPWRRAALGAVGWMWLLGAAPLAGRILYLPLLPPITQWTGSLSGVTHGFLVPAVQSGALAPALVWGLGAAVLPWVVGGRRLAVDAAFALLWAAILTVGVRVAVAATHSPGGGAGLGAPRGAVLGAAAAAALALGVPVLRRWRGTV